MAEKIQVTHESKDKDIVPMVHERYSSAYYAKLEYTERIRMELSYYLGETWNYQSPRSNRMIRITDSEIRALREKKKLYLININKCRPAVNVFVSKLTQRKPKLYVYSRSDDDQSKGAAKAATEILDDFRKKDDYLQKDIFNAYWLSIVGKSYKYVKPILKDKVRKQKKQEIVELEPEVTITDEPQEAPVQEPDIFGEKEEVALSAEVEVVILNAFEVFTPPGIKRIPDMPWIMIVKFIDRTEAEERFGIEFPESDEIITDSIEFDQDFGMFTGGRKGDQKILIEYFQKPSDKAPRGLHIAMIDDKVLLKDEFPYWNTYVDKSGELKEEWGGYRITDYTYTDTMVSHWGQGMIYPVLDLQRKINMLWSGFYTSRLVTQSPKLLVPRGYKASKDEFTNVPSIIDRSSFTGEPAQWREPPRVANDSMDMIHALERKFDEGTGIHQLSMGEEPLKRLPFLAIRFIQDLDMDKFRPFFDNYEEQERKHGMDIINALKQYNPEYMLNAVDFGDEPDVKQLMITKLQDHDVIVERGSSVPEMLAGKQGMLLELLKYNAFDMANRQTRISFTKAIDEGWARELVDRETSAAKFAEQENKRLLNPEPIAEENGAPIMAPVPVHEYQDHEIHINEHSRLFDSSTFWKMTPAIQQGVTAHINEHQGFMQQAQMQQIQMQLELEAQSAQAQQGIPPQVQQEAPVTEAELLGQEL